MSEIHYAKDEKDFEAYFRSNQLFVLNFTASWCPPCRAIKPHVDQFYETYKNVEVLRIDIDENQKIAKDNGIASIPTLIFYHNHKQVGYVKGANLGDIKANFEKLSKLEPDAVRKGDGTGPQL